MKKQPNFYHRLIQLCLQIQQRRRYKRARVRSKVYREDLQAYKRSRFLRG